MSSTMQLDKTRPKQHFGRLHTPLHAFLEMPPESRSAVVWNTQLSALAKYIERAQAMNPPIGQVHVSRDMPLADPFYNHAWLEAYDALDGHPYQEKLHGLFAQWWTLPAHVAFDVVSRGIHKRMPQNPELLVTGLAAMQGINRENLFLKIVKRARFLSPVLFSDIVRIVTPIAEKMKWTADFTNNETLRGQGNAFDPKAFIEAMSLRLSSFGRFNTNHLDLPAYDRHDGLQAFLDVAEMRILVEGARLPAAPRAVPQPYLQLHDEPELSLQM